MMLRKIFHMRHVHRGRATYTPTPSVPTRMPNTSASLAFCTTAYLLINNLFVRPDSILAVLVLGSYECTLSGGQEQNRQHVQLKSGKPTSDWACVIMRFVRLRLSPPTNKIV